MKGILGRKVGMTSVFTKEGRLLPVTVIEVLPNKVMQIKTVEKDGYNAIQVGTVAAKEKHLTKAQIGHLKKNNVENLSVEQIAKIYTGEITNWSDLGGADEQIVVIGREDGSGTRDGFESIVMGDKEPKYAQELESTGSVINAVATTDGAIGYASLANVDETVKALKVGGVEATEENVKSGAYEVQRPFICATLKGSDNKLAKAYLDFILSEEGQALVLAQGAVPVK